MGRDWLGLSGGGGTKPGKPGTESGATAELRAACCLAALDCGLLCAEPLTRLCVTEDDHLQNMPQTQTMKNQWKCQILQADFKLHLVSALQRRDLDRAVEAHCSLSGWLGSSRSGSRARAQAGAGHPRGGTGIPTRKYSSWQTADSTRDQYSWVDHQTGLDVKRAGHTMQHYQTENTPSDKTISIM